MRRTDVIPSILFKAGCRKTLAEMADVVSSAVGSTTHILHLVADGPTVKDEMDNMRQQVIFQGLVV